MKILLTRWHQRGSVLAVNNIVSFIIVTLIPAINLLAESIADNTTVVGGVMDDAKCAADAGLCGTGIDLNGGA